MKNKGFEDYLYDRHADQYTGTDDLMPEDCEEWVADLDVDTLIKYADAWMKEEMEKKGNLLKRACELLEKYTAEYFETETLWLDHRKQVRDFLRAV